MSKFRILSIFLAVGLLVGALGVGPVLAGQIDVTGLDTRDASYAPAQTTVDLDDGEVEWTDAAGVKISHVNIGNAVFYIQDGDLQTVSDPQIAMWKGSDPYTSNGQTNGFNVLDGVVGSDTSQPSQVTFTLTGLPDSEEDPVYSVTTTPPDENFDSNLDSGNFVNFDNRWFATSTFAARVAVDSEAANVVYEVKGGDTELKPIHAVSKMEFHTANPAATSTVSTVVESSRNLVKVIGGTSVPVDRVKVTFTHHKYDVYDGDKQRARVVSTSDPDGEFVQIKEVAGEGSETAVANSTVFLGNVLLSDNAAHRGANDDGVWVQHGDTLSVSYLDEDGAVVETDEINVDAAGPAISGMTPSNNTVTSTNNPTLQFDATDTDSGIAVAKPSDSFMVKVGTEYQEEPNENKIDLTTGMEIQSANLSYVAVLNGYRVIYAPQTSWLKTFSGLKDGSPFNVSVWAMDTAGNGAFDDQPSMTVKITIDSKAPETRSAKTGIGWDSAKDEEVPGTRNAIRLVLSEAIDPDSVDPSDFEIDGEAAATAVVGEHDKDAEINPAWSVYLTAEDDFDPGAKPKVEIVDDVSDLAGTDIVTGKSGARKTADDGVDPVLTVSRDVQLLGNEDEVVFTIESDEKLGGSTVTIAGPSGSKDNFTGSAKATEPLAYTLTREIANGTGHAGIYGASVQIEDVAKNTADNLVNVKSETVAAKNIKVENGNTTITLENGPVGDRDFSGDVDHKDVTFTATDKDDLVATSTTAGQDYPVTVDAGGRTIEIEDFSAVKATVSYKYVAAEHTFEVDEKAPDMTVEANSIALNNDTSMDVADASPFINVKFDDAEYPGDSYTDVTLTSAILTMGDGDGTDIMGDFAVEANGHNWLYAAFNLTLGDYTLEVKGEDIAGNEASGTVKFAIIRKPATKIALSPGQNLISLPGNPATTSIEGVITNPNVKSVLTYDPSTPTKWLAAERAPDGSWVGNLTEISGNLGYWVTTSNFDPLEVDIVTFSAGGAELPPTHNLVPGWNLVAVTVLDEKKKTVDANFYFGNNWLRAITYNASTRTFVTLGPDDDDAPMLDVGKGYFVWMTKPHTVVP